MRNKRFKISEKIVKGIKSSNYVRFSGLYAKYHNCLVKIFFVDKEKCYCILLFNKLNINLKF